MRYKWCKKIGHKWVYSITSVLGKRVELRACKRCGCIEEYRKDMLWFGDGWFMLVMRTKKGSEKLLSKLKETI